MLDEITSGRVYIACGVTDMRKSIDGLATMVTCSFKLDPFSDSLFVFCNRNQDKLKILRWDCNGFWLYYRRLERGRFRWPASDSDKTMTIDHRQLRWLLDGLQLEQRGAHREVMARKVA